MSTRDFLVELGTEELPPKALETLSISFREGISGGLLDANLDFDSIETFAAPRRLAVIVRNLQSQQADQEEVLYGPPAKIAFDADGNPTKAALGFAARAGADASELKTAPDSDKKNAGKLMLERTIKGKQTTELLAGIVQNSLDKLPIPKRMRWGASRIEFVRPVQWLVMLFGNDVVDAEV